MMAWRTRSSRSSSAEFASGAQAPLARTIGVRVVQRGHQGRPGVDPVHAAGRQAERTLGAGWRASNNCRTTPCKSADDTQPMRRSQAPSRVGQRIHQRQNVVEQLRAWRDCSARTAQRKHLAGAWTLQRRQATGRRHAVRPRPSRPDGRRCVRPAGPVVAAPRAAPAPARCAHGAAWRLLRRAAAPPRAKCAAPARSRR